MAHSLEHIQMSEWTETDRRIGLWSATCAATIGLVFVIVGLIGVVARPASSDLLRQVDPYLAVLEILMIQFAVVLVSLLAALHAYARPERRTFSLTAFALVICFAVLTCGVHFASLTVGRQIDPSALPLMSHQLSFGEWPTVAMSVDLLAWDFFLGLALLFAAQVFKGEATLRVRGAMTMRERFVWWVLSAPRPGTCICNTWGLRATLLCFRLLALCWQYSSGAGELLSAASA